jgi:hypothetical protein
MPGVFVCLRFDGPPIANVGASLLAIAVDQLALMLNVLTPSRAGSLPQGGGVQTPDSKKAPFGAFCFIAI